MWAARKSHSLASAEKKTPGTTCRATASTPLVVVVNSRLSRLKPCGASVCFAHCTMAAFSAVRPSAVPAVRRCTTISPEHLAASRLSAAIASGAAAGTGMSALPATRAAVSTTTVHEACSPSARRDSIARFVVPFAGPHAAPEALAACCVARASAGCCPPARCVGRPLFRLSSHHATKHAPTARASHVPLTSTPSRESADRLDRIIPQ
mmetsp:Transcript_41886/g.129471  ORF Transcript_41886/g.129471 Transcript_41886/m.129471 type:complete len:208 (-) Transcript_41886:16-639(-)